MSVPESGDWSPRMLFLVAVLAGVCGTAIHAHFGTPPEAAPAAPPRACVLTETGQKVCGKPVREHPPSPTMDLFWLGLGVWL